MPRIRRILAPTDFSPCAQHAVDFALDLAEQLHASVDILHVSDVASAEPRWTPNVSGLDDILNCTRQGEQLVALVGKVGKRTNAQVRGRIQSGDPTATIVRIAEEEPYDLVVMGSHGHVGIAHLVLGSVAEQVARRSQTPVTIVRGPRPV